MMQRLSSEAELLNCCHLYVRKRYGRQVIKGPYVLPLLRAEAPVKTHHGGR